MKPNIKDKLQKIDKDHYQILIDIGKVAQEEKLNAYLVGGMVRDLLLGFENLDIDIVVEHSASILADALVKKLSNCKLLVKHDRFFTAKVEFTINGKKIPIDLASSREEIYESPASLPKVSISDLKRDLYRRDFTINALAVSIMPDEFGDVVDLFDGLIDLKNKKIRVLHDLSFVDDPTRMIRAVRFASKFGFELEEHTKRLMKEAIESKQFDNLVEKIRGDRVKIEIRYLFNLPNIEEAIKAFFESGVYRMISTSLRGGQSPTKQSPEVFRDEIASVTSFPRNDRQWLIYLAIAMKDLDSQRQQKIMRSLQMTTEEIKIIKSAFQACERLQEKNINSMSVYKILKDLPIESVLINKLFSLTSHLSPLTSHLSPLTSLINEYLESTSKIKLKITGEDLITMGVRGGKKIGEILDRVLELKIKNPTMTKKDELKEAEKLISDR